MLSFATSSGSSEMSIAMARSVGGDRETGTANGRTSSDATAPAVPLTSAARESTR